MYDSGWYLGDKAIEKLTPKQLLTALVLACEELGALRGVLHDWREARRKHDLHQCDLHHNEVYETWPKRHVLPQDAGLPDEPVSANGKYADEHVGADPTPEEQARQARVAHENFEKNGTLTELTPEQEQLLRDTEPENEKAERQLKEKVAELSADKASNSYVVKIANELGRVAKLYDELQKRVTFLDAYRSEQVKIEGFRNEQRQADSEALERRVGDLSGVLREHRECLGALDARLQAIEELCKRVSNGRDPLHHPRATTPSPATPTDPTDHGKQ